MSSTNGEGKGLTDRLSPSTRGSDALVNQLPVQAWRLRKRTMGHEGAESRLLWARGKPFGPGLKLQRLSSPRLLGDTATSMARAGTATAAAGASSDPCFPHCSGSG